MDPGRERGSSRGPAAWQREAAKKIRTLRRFSWRLPAKWWRGEIVRQNLGGVKMGCGEGSMACSWSLTHQRSDIRAHKSKRDLEDGGKASGWCAAPPALESFCVCYSQRNGGTAKSYDKSWVGSKWD